jgi:uncharacterized protein
MTTDLSPSARLCAACGMCCDGVLFHAVNLQAGDSARQLASLGMKIRRKKGVEFFLQPCFAHSETEGSCTCAIYDQRPARCRLFNCKQLLRVASAETSEADALEKISEARARVARVNELISEFGESNLNRSLAHRVAHALTLQKGEERTPLHDRLDGAMIELEALLEKEFRVG